MYRPKENSDSRVEFTVGESCQKGLVGGSPLVRQLGVLLPTVGTRASEGGRTEFYV